MHVLSAAMVRELSSGRQQQQLLQPDNQHIRRLHTQPGTKVWAKLKGYPWWPGQIAKEAAMPPTAMPSRKVPSAIPILFYGSNDYAWLQPADIKPFVDENGPGAAKQQAAKLLEAIKLAVEDLAPTGRPPFVAQQDNSEGHDGDAGKDERDVEDGDGSKKKRRASAPKKTPGKSTPRPTKALQTPKTPTTGTPGSTGPRSLKRKAPPSVASSKSKKSRSDENEEKQNAGQHAEGATPIPEKGNKEPRKNRSPFEHLMYLRHKIQKMMKEDPVLFGAIERMDECIREIENFTMSIDLLKQTKVGKLMKKLTQMNIDPDPNNVKIRADLLIRKWKTEFHIDTQEPEPTRDAVGARGQAADNLESDDKPSSAGEGEEASPMDCDTDVPSGRADVKENGKDSADVDKGRVIPAANTTFTEETGAGATALKDGAVGGKAGGQDADDSLMKDASVGQFSGHQKEAVAAN